MRTPLCVFGVMVVAGVGMCNGGVMDTSINDRAARPEGDPQEGQQFSIEKQEADPARSQAPQKLETVTER